MRKSLEREAGRSRIAIISRVSGSIKISITFFTALQLVLASSCPANSEVSSAGFETTPLQRNVKPTFPIIAASVVLAIAPGCALIKGPQKDAKPVATFENSGGSTTGSNLTGGAPAESLLVASAGSGEGTGQGSISIDSVLKPSAERKTEAPASLNSRPSPPVKEEKPDAAPVAIQRPVTSDNPPPLLRRPSQKVAATVNPASQLMLAQVQAPNQQLLALAERGELAAKAYCATCHFFPEPKLLDRATWLNMVLPAMRAGGSRHTPAATPGSIDITQTVSPLTVAQIKAVPLGDEVWQSILAYYAVNSPEALETPTPPRGIDFDLRHFRAEIPENYLVKSPATNAIRIDETRGHILVGETDPNTFLVFDSSLILIQEARLSSPPTWFEHFTEPGSTQRKLTLTLSGKMDPNDLAIGNLVSIEEQPPGADVVYDKPMTMITKLRRPVNTRFADFDGDGVLEALVGQFGDTIGQIAYYKQGAGDQVTEKVLIPRPGSISSYVLDYDEDGDQDVLTLMTQAREGVHLLRNDGAGNFTEEPLVLLPSVYGSSSFDLADVNGDKKLDIILTCGDNADHSMIFKPYHGLYIFLNEGDDKYDEGYFYPINGAFNAKARDFDQDGDVDIVALAYFADFDRRPFESLIYFENEGDAQLFDFHPFTIEQALIGRWLTMDVGDVDKDGDIDIVFGNFLRRLMGPGTLPEDLKAKWAQPGPHFLLLRNTTKDGES
ncbi:MAG: hypothetical protein ACI8UO_005482 [Verrucomicrobiales bacterium]|jgi:hypothetical protein